MEDRLTRIGIFYDGNYFSHVSNYYLYNHERRARISIEGLHRFVRRQVAESEGTDERYCQVVDAHYFRGRLSASEAQERDSLYGERLFDEVLMRAGVTTHYMPLSNSGEKGIDVWFALEAFELAMYKRFTVSVLSHRGRGLRTLGQEAEHIGDPRDAPRVGLRVHQGRPAADHAYFSRSHR